MTKIESDKIINGLTFGFEIEGIFSESIVEHIENKELGQFCGDGSVVFNGAEIPANFKNSSSYLEFKSYKIKKYTDLIELMSIFNRNTHIYNSSCGLHLHLGHDLLKTTTNSRGYTKRRFNDFMSNYKMIKKLQALVKDNSCICQLNRLDKAVIPSSYYSTYKSLASFKRGIKYYDKYRFCRYHPQGTIEFRYLSPCAHKIDNTKKLIEYIKDYLVGTEKIKNSNVAIDNGALSDRINILHDLKPTDKMVIDLGKIKPRYHTVLVNDEPERPTINDMMTEYNYN